MTHPGGSGRGADPRHPGRQYLGKSHKEELVVGEPHGWQLLLLPVLSQPCFVRLGLSTGVESLSGPAHHLHPAPYPPGRVGLNHQKAGQATHVVGSLKPPIVSNVLPQSLAAIELLPIDLVLAVLLLHAGRVILEGCQ